MVDSKLLAKVQEAFATREYWPAFDRTTYKTQKLWIGFMDDFDLKKIWAFTVAKRWKVDPVEFYKICPDVCPCYNTPLDYGFGNNIIKREAQGRGNDWFRPAVDHIKPKDIYPELKYGHIENLQILSSRANRIKNNARSKEELLLVAKNGFGKNRS